MPLMPGRTLGPYEVIEPIGAGGMGAVYRGRDTRLNRAVAIKVLSEELMADRKLRDRLMQEARSISSLSHPNICALYDMGSEGNIDYLVMEFLEGETLAARLARGRMPLPTALKHAAEIAGALDAAHRAGVVHRDLKPANVMLVRNGAKLVDFGLAKTAADASPDSDAETARALTDPGAVVGTLPYMSPEQLAGVPVDSRSDVFSFGTMLYEMLSGQRPFHGPSRMNVITAILNETPGALDGIPDSLQRVVRKCLEKNPDERWQSAADLRDELQWIASGSVAAAVPTQSRRRWPAVAAVTALVAAIAIAGWAIVANRAPSKTVSQIRFGINPPAGTFFTQRATNGELAVSPDGQWIAFVALQGGRRSMYLRPLNDLAAHEMEGTGGAMSPFWSPDSRWIGFFAAGSMKKVSLSGGPVQTICAAHGGSGSWGKNGNIIFAEWGPTASDQIEIVSANGGVKRELAGTKGWHYWPSFLADGTHYLFMLNQGALPGTGLYSTSVDGGKAILLVPHVRRAEVAADDWIYYVRDDALVKQKINAAATQVLGEPVTVAEHVFSFMPTGNANFSVSATGNVVAYQRLTLESHLVWRDRNGHETGRLKIALQCRKFQISPDGNRVAIERFEPQSGVSNLWIHDVGRDVMTRVTSRDFGAFSPVWSPDGRELVFSDVAPKDETSPPQLTRLSVETEATRALMEHDGVEHATDVTPDGKDVLYTIDRGDQQDIELLSMDGSRKITKLESSDFNESSGALSPDGHWMAFVSDESGRPEIYVTLFGHHGVKTRVSLSGGTEPRWSTDGRDLFFLAPDGMLMHAATESGPSIRIATPAPLFYVSSAGMMDLAEMGLCHYDVAPNGTFLVREIAGADDAPVVVIAQ